MKRSQPPADSHKSQRATKEKTLYDALVGNMYKPGDSYQQPSGYTTEKPEKVGAKVGLFTFGT